MSGARTNGGAARTALSIRLRQQGPVPLDVALECAGGELLALMGPSGSGKTTTLRIAAGIERVAEGRVACAGEIWLDTARGVALAPERRRAGLVFQHYALFPHLSARENVAIAMGHRPRAERAGRAEALLERVNMGGLGERRPAALSGGQRQRVALARALAREPAALLLDEPFSAVDTETRRRLHRELARLRAALALPIVLVTHDLVEVQRLADTLSVIHHGRTLQSGAVEQVVERPASRTVAKLLGHRNLLRAELVGRDGVLARYRVGDTVLAAPAPRAEAPRALTLLVPQEALVVEGLDEGRRPGRLLRTSRLEGRIAECVALGDTLSLRLRLARVPKALRLTLPRHARERLALEPGTPLAVRVRADAVHLIERD